MPVTRILIVDDQSIILDGLEALIGQNDDFVVCGRASNGREAVEKAQQLEPDVVLMDINMPEMDGIEATRRLKKSVPDVKVLVLSMYNHPEFVRELLDAGASGYLLKNTGRHELRQAILSVASGERFLAAPVQDVLNESNRRTPERTKEDGYHALTRREKEIIRYIVAGHTSHEIADMLCLSPATVETHRKNICHKLALRNTAGIVRYAMERGWGTEKN